MTWRAHVSSWEPDSIPMVQIASEMLVKFLDVPSEAEADEMLENF